MDQQLIMRPDSETLLKQTEIGQEQGTSLNTLIYLPWYQNECSASVGQFGELLGFRYPEMDTRRSKCRASNSVYTTKGQTGFSTMNNTMFSYCMHSAKTKFIN